MNPPTPEQLCNILDRLEALANNLADSLNKYQGRYHGAAHATKDWNEAQKRLGEYNQFIAGLHRS